jgi:hypothetical protein
MIVTTETVDIETPGSPMRTFVAAPKSEGTYPGILLYSDIFQGAGPSGLVVGLDRDRFQGKSSPGLTGCSPGTLTQRVLTTSPRKLKYAQ